SEPVSKISSSYGRSVMSSLLNCRSVCILAAYLLGSRSFGGFFSLFAQEHDKRAVSCFCGVEYDSPRHLSK
ncbi:MAG: hypothetical protein ACPGGN_08335, partial [Opitutales bacterium]